MEKERKIVLGWGLRHRGVIVHDVLTELHLGLEAEAHLGGKCCSGWRWAERLNPDQGEPAEEVRLYSVGKGRVLKIWG